MNHAFLGRNIQYANLFMNNITDKKTRYLTTPEDFNIEISEYQLPEPFSILPLKFYNASSDDVQDLFFGKTKIENINIKRLEQFTGQNISCDDINFLPHPFG